MTFYKFSRQLFIIDVHLIFDRGIWTYGKVG